MLTGREEKRRIPLPAPLFISAIAELGTIIK